MVFRFFPDDVVEDMLASHKKGEDQQVWRCLISTDLRLSPWEEQKEKGGQNLKEEWLSHHVIQYYFLHVLETPRIILGALKVSPCFAECRPHPPPPQLQMREKQVQREEVTPFRAFHFSSRPTISWLRHSLFSPILLHLLSYIMFHPPTPEAHFTFGFLIQFIVLSGSRCEDKAACLVCLFMVGIPLTVGRGKEV